MILVAVRTMGFGRFPVVGTPFPATAETDKNKFIPAWKQEARDEKGSRRFHGAFTGGFSAGYHNTVGSKEGWQPSTFVSSRGQTQGQASVTKPEDFMDEEDLKEMKQGKLTVVTGSANPAPRDEFTLMLNSLTDYKDEALGWKLLKKLGWNGDRTKNIKGPATLLLESHLRDRPPSDTTCTDRKPFMGITGGIGTGILDDDEDGDSIYDDNSQRGLTIPRDGPSMKPAKLPRTKRIESKPTKRSSDDLIEGFVPSMQIIFEEKIYAPPMIPSDFRPRGLAAFPEYTIATEAAASNAIDKPKTTTDHHHHHNRKPSTKNRLDVATAMSALRGFMPYQADARKDARYKQFLNYSAAPDKFEAPVRPSELSEKEWELEIDSFIKSASIFKPLPSVMASRFVSSAKATIATDPSQMKSGLYQPPPPSTTTTTPTTGSPAQETQEPSQTQSQDHKVPLPYGPLTRSVVPWTPSSIVCSRLGCEAPLNAAPISVTEPTPKLLSIESLQNIVKQSSYAEAASNISEDSIQLTLRESLTDAIDKRPAMDLFMEIFGDLPANAPKSSESVENLSQAPLFASQPPPTNTYPNRLTALSFDSDLEPSPKSLSLSPFDWIHTQSQQSLPIDAAVIETVTTKPVFIKRKAPKHIRKPLTTTTYVEDPVLLEEASQESKHDPTDGNEDLKHANEVQVYPTLANPKKSARPSASDFW